MFILQMTAVPKWVALGWSPFCVELHAPPCLYGFSLDVLVTTGQNTARSIKYIELCHNDA